MTGSARNGANGATTGVKSTVLDALPVSVEAILGVARIPIGELTRLSPGDVFTLDSLLGDPVELRLNGETIAFGELVSHEDNFAVRIQAIARE